MKLKKELGKGRKILVTLDALDALDGEKLNFINA